MLKFRDPKTAWIWVTEIRIVNPKQISFQTEKHNSMVSPHTKDPDNLWPFEKQVVEDAQNDQYIFEIGT